ALSTINSSQLETDENGNEIMDKNRPKTRSCQSEIILSHQIGTAVENNSSLSISNTLLDRSLSDYKLTTLHISPHNSIGCTWK
ncbi:unnamed protein product, partial [Rotaria socialis]